MARPKKTSIAQKAEEVVSGTPDYADIFKVMDRQFGKGAVGTLEGPYSLGMKEVDVIPTGSHNLDHALGIRGWPRGRFVEVYGPESSGKTTLAVNAVVQAQKMGLGTAYIDAEHAFSVPNARDLDCDLSSMLFTQPNSGEEGLQILETLISSAKMGLIVVDSIAALTPQAELDGDIGDKHVGLQSRMLSQACRKLSASAARTNTLVIWINQIRAKIGDTYNPTTTPGGNAMKFYASVRAEVRQIGKLQTKSGDEVGDSYGIRTKVFIKKNKMAPPFKSAEYDLIFGQGINRMGEILDIGIRNQIIRKDGSWYKYQDSSIGQGSDRASEFLEEHPEICTAILEKLWAPIEVPAGKE